MNYQLLDQLSAIGASPDAMSALWAIAAYLAAGVGFLVMLYSVLCVTAHIVVERRRLRQRALSRVRGLAL